ncbi:hypothetical protein HYH02_007753 [Chlamydomonas schloesseri]|uniref:IPO4/5-like TPR repeats domain-containing protein n=1 Tax=Chlamydomonas schloesseri TaxID=2026947 RepID=A0A836B4K9_9CHLO|nr:hypothetical protein HYH02_007753 [Chlamydomonas schloesseri]|eukprot:KAG2447427.1 hypothetical protein HYH02_007753 [Chlamydomonas schloesseri]
MSAAQIQVILASPQSFAGLIGQTLSTDNATRKSAEDLYSSLRRQRPDACATNLLQLLRTSSEVLVRSTCAVFLRKVVVKSSGKEPGWDQLSKSTQAVVKRELLAALAAEVDRNTAKQVAAVVIELGEQVMDEVPSAAPAKRGGRKKAPAAPKCGWPELLAGLQAWLQGGDVSAVTREAALKVVAGLAMELRTWAAQLAPVITACLAPQAELAVQLAALSAVSAFLEVLRKPAELRPYQAALAGGLGSLQAALAAGNTDLAEQLLVVLVQTAEREPALWQPHVRAAVPGMLALAGPAAGPGGAPLPDDLRKLAAEFVLTLVDIKPQMVQSEMGAGPLAAQLVSCLAHFLTCGVEDDPTWGDDPMAYPDMDADETLGELHRHGLECATRAADSLDSGAMLRAVVDMTGAWAADASDWRRRHAVLMCLSQVVGSVKEVVGPAELASLAGLLVGGLRDSHPRVRWAACHSLGVLCGDLGPALQLAPGGGGGVMLGALAELLAEPEGPACPQRLKANACRALVGFLEGLDAEPEEEAGAAGAAAAALSEEQRKAATVALVAPHLQPLAGPLLAAVDRCAAGEGGSLAGGRALVPTPTQEFSVDVLCRLACALGSSFASVYPAAMPRVLAVLGRCAAFHGPTAVASGSVTEDEATAIVRVQVGALECAVFTARAAGAAAAAEHLPALAALFGQLCRPDIASSSPLLVPLLAAVEPLAACLGPAVAPVLPPVLPLLAQWATRDVGLESLEDSDDEEPEEGDDDGEGAGGDAHASDSDSGEGDSEGRDDSDVGFVSYGGADYRYVASVAGAKAAAVSALEELVDRMGPAVAPQAPALAEALSACLLDYPLDDVVGPARTALPKLLRAYLAALSSGTLPASEPAASPAAAQALLLRLWQAVTAVLNFEAVAAPAAGPEGAVAGGAGLGPLMALPGCGLKRPTPTSATRADMAELLAAIVDCVEGSMLQQQWVADAFAALQAATKAAALEANVEQFAGADSDEEEEDDKSMDGSEDVDDEESERSEEEESEEDSGEKPAEARERLRTQVAACVSAFSRKYGDAVAALAQQLLAAAQPDQQLAALMSVRGGVVA